MKTLSITISILLLSISIQASERTVIFENEALNVKPKFSQKFSSASCDLQKHANIGTGYQTGQAPDDIIVTYFDPATCSTPGYPFQVESFSFTLIPLVNNSWPVKMDVVIFSPVVSGVKCSGPGDELYRFTVDCDSASWAIPVIGTAFFPDTFCIDEPFFIGLNYADSFSHAPTYPSIFFDTTAAPDSCDNYYFFDVAPAEWHEWYDFWGFPMPGYPWFEVGGTTLSSACISDSDGDGIVDSLDNCPNEPNPLQADNDSDLIGNLCDNCPDDSNPSQTDLDNDGIGDVCDDCPSDFLNDTDNDGICESVDNCPGIYNPLQVDTDMDGRGDLCENCCIGIRGNVDNDAGQLIDISDLVFLVDYMFLNPNIGASPPCFEEADVNNDTLIDISDLVFLVDYMFSSPAGPPPLSCF